jgi:ribosomal protein L32
MVIRMRHTRAHTGNRRSHHALKAGNFSVDPKTGTVHKTHRVDPTTGMYNGRQVLDVTKKAVKKAKSK